MFSAFINNNNDKKGKDKNLLNYANMDRNIWSVCRGQPSSIIYTHLNACVEIAVAFKDPLAVVPAILHHSKH